ncbi:MAG: hypothetical protein ACI9R3_006111 [Verrucomicrobiales bacterium]|jgi:hypothetical protein
MKTLAIIFKDQSSIEIEAADWGRSAKTDMLRFLDEDSSVVATIKNDEVLAIIVRKHLVSHQVARKIPSGK